VKKIEEARASIAQVLLGLHPGDTLPRTLELAKGAGVGVGTAQAALDSLEADGVIALSAHGSRGRRLVTSDTALLWRDSARGALTAVLPLPESREFAGLATALSAECAAAGVPLQLLFRQGSRTRIDQVASKIVDFSLMSLHAAQHAAAPLSWIPLGEYTYYARDAVVTITRRDQAPGHRARVGIDRSSSDHVALTLSAFPDTTHVDVPYLFIPEALARGEVDAAIWHRTTSSPVMTASGLDLHELSGAAPDPTLLEAVLAWRGEDTGVGSLLASTISVPRLRAVQREVMDGVRVPQF